MAREIAIPVVLSMGIGVAMYALAIQKEKPLTASATFSVIGAAAALMSIGSSFSARMSAAKALRAGQGVANNVNTIVSLGQR